MFEKLDFFIPRFCLENNATVAELVSDKYSRVFIIDFNSVPVNSVQSDDTSNSSENNRVETLCLTDSIKAMSSIRAIAEHATAEYTAIYISNETFTPTYGLTHRLSRVLADTDVTMLYTDRYETQVTETGNVLRTLHRAEEFLEGSVRDDFDFGGLVIVKTSLLHDFIAEETNDWKYAGWYSLRLYLSRRGEIMHLREPLYEQCETDTRHSGQKQFDYVNPRMREVQIEMEKAFTLHLKAIDAYLAPDEIDNTSVLASLNVEESGLNTFGVKASVIIPVRNRVKTIGDALKSAANQETTFPYNVIVIDNHSDDGTFEVVNNACEQGLDGIHACKSNFKGVICIHPEREDLGIGGCWDLAIHDSRCGEYAVQLDSDDLYSGTDTLQRIIDKFEEEDAAMVVGSYRMVDFELNTLPPGLIDHKEWTDDNGRNNALRINGLGAPRAFKTNVLRLLGIPNTSYGEDYALGLSISRRFRIARIFDELYLCRRWDGNSDALLSNDKVVRNNAYKDGLRTQEIKARKALNRRWKSEIDADKVRWMEREQMLVWPETGERFEALVNQAEHRVLNCKNGAQLIVQHNPVRMVSTGAKTDAESISRRPCFLCSHNRPVNQLQIDVERLYTILVNPYPILPRHLTIPTRRHVPQQFLPHLSVFLRMSWEMPEYFMFYNGPRSGASAPDHAHFQSGERGHMPLEHEWNNYSNKLLKLWPETHEETTELEEHKYNPESGIYLLKEYACPAYVIIGEHPDNDAFMLRKLIKTMHVEEGQSEPDMNILCWRQKGTAGSNDHLVTIIFARSKHRPDCYFATNENEQYIISPGSIDMGGLIIAPRHDDFLRITPSKATEILREVTCTEKQLLQMARDLHQANRRTKTSSHLSDDHTEPIVEVGIMSESQISFNLLSTFRAKGQLVSGHQEVRIAEGGIEWQGNIYAKLTFHALKAEDRFELENVTIGKGFHWQQQERQIFGGNLRFIALEGRLTAINLISVEDYLKSVISSEMSGAAPAELLKAHAIISRSWLMRQILQRRRGKEGDDLGFFTFQRTEDEYIKWYDRTEHSDFDVCADDHCQRYQGLTRSGNPEVAEAIESTRGMVLCHDGEICDARFSKCCGGQTERFSACWDNHDEAYLESTEDPYCGQADSEILARSLNDYDNETKDFYRWKIEISQEELCTLLKEKLGEDFGKIKALEPVERGDSYRIIRLRIVGTNRMLIIGKELEIRRALSPTHLLSSAFDVEPLMDEGTDIPHTFRLTGRGWGHGVGLCQIGAAVMAEKGLSYNDILAHYYHHSEILKAY